MGFQSKVNAQPALAVAGDFADANVRAFVLAGPGALLSAPTPRECIVGNFGWADQTLGRAYGRSYGESGLKLGFVHRENNSLITQFLTERRVTVQPGQMMTLFNQGSFWVSLTAAAQVGQKAFARYLDGSVYAAAAGASTTTASAMTGSIAVTTGVLTVSALTGVLNVGAILSGGVVPAGTAITSQLSGTPGGIGTYQTTTTLAAANLTSAIAAESVETSFTFDSPVAVAASITASLSATGVLTVSAVASGALEIDQFLAGTGLPANARILQQLTGSAGSTGTYRTNLTQGPVLTSRAMTATQGQLAKISTWG